MRHPDGMVLRAVLCACLAVGVGFAQRGGGHGGGGAGGMRGGGGGMVGGGGGFRGGGMVGGGGGFRGGGFVGGGGFHGGGFNGGHNNFGFRGGVFVGNRGFRGFYGGYWPYSYGVGYWPYAYPYYSYPYYDYGYSYDPYDYPSYSYSYPISSYAYPAQQQVVVAQPAYPQQQVYAQPVNPTIRQYDQYGQEMHRGDMASGGSLSNGSPVYLIAFNDHVIRAAAAYWVSGNTLHYVTLDRQEHQASLDSVDRAMSDQLNHERRVQFSLK